MIGYVYSSTLATILATAAITTTSASLFGDSSTGDDTITQNQHLVTICMTEEDCVAAAVQLGVTTVYTDVNNSATKGCFQKNGKVFWGSDGNDEQMSELDLPGEQSRLFCNNPEAREIVTVNPFPHFIMPVWTVTEYHPSLEVGDDIGLVKPNDGSAITLKLDTYNDFQGRTGCNAYFGEYTSMSPSSFLLGDDGIGHTLMECDENAMKQEENYLYNWHYASIIYWDILQDGTLELKSGNHPDRVMAVYKTVCMTSADCDAAAIKLGFTEGHSSEEFPSKGCYSKNGRAFWSDGTEEEKAVVQLPGVRERIFCPVNVPAVIVPSTASPMTASPVSPSRNSPASPPAENPVSDLYYDGGSDDRMSQELKASSGKMITLGVAGTAVILLSAIMF